MRRRRRRRGPSSNVTTAEAQQDSPRMLQRKRRNLHEKPQINLAEDDDERICADEEIQARLGFGGDAERRSCDRNPDEDCSRSSVRVRTAENGAKSKDRVECSSDSLAGRRLRLRSGRLSSSSSSSSSSSLARLLMVLWGILQWQGRHLFLRIPLFQSVQGFFLYWLLASLPAFLAPASVFLCLPRVFERKYVWV